MTQAATLQFLKTHWRRILVLLVPLLLCGCATAPGPASISTGECKVFDAPTYAVRGARPYDQDWIDSTVEGGVGACHWNRPAPRPAAMDTPVKAHVIKAAPVKPKKKPLWLRMLHWRSKVPAPAVVAAPVAAPLPAEPAPLPPPPVPRSAVDELLTPTTAAQ